MTLDPLRMTYEGGTIRLSGGDDTVTSQLPFALADGRGACHRAEGRHYRRLVEHVRSNKIPYVDEARAYLPVEWKLRAARKPFPHQAEALEAWWKTGARGTVILPTGTGKTFLAILAIARAGRPALVVTPTIDLLNQWYAELEDAFGGPIGLMGGGHYELQPITVTTYDSAYIHLDRWGNRFGLVVFDECHHLPSGTYQTAAIGAIAPFRLGLTATLERGDGLESLIPELIGPVIYRREITELAGDYLAEYRVERCYVDLSEAEQAAYQSTRETYRRFVEDHGISLGSPSGWQRFLREISRSTEGREAFLAYREQRRIAQAAPGKLRWLEQFLGKGPGSRTLIFTYDNLTVYQIARRFLIPAITHQTRARERREILKRFHAGDFNTLVTSQVLNEGVDVPAANVGIILSGTGSVREHVQRLGRLLRKHGDKQATLYEVIARGTAEEFTSERRRQHQAYQ